MRAKFAARIRIIASAIILIALVLLIRLYGLTIVHGANFRDRAEGQYSGGSTDFNRGSIFFTDKDGLKVSAATLASGATLAVIPPQIEDAEAAYQKINALFPLDEATFLAKAKKANDPYEEIVHRVPENIAQAIDAENIPGVRMVSEEWRLYPAGAAAAHVIGLVGYGAESVLSGQYGLERFYNDVLMRGVDALSQNFFADLFSGIQTRLFSQDARAGGDVVTSIEPSVQTFMEGALDNYMSEWHPESAGAIVLDPKTGNVIAMAARPNFDPNNLKGSNTAALANPLVERVYEFGSIMKPLTMAAAMDAGVVTTDTTYNDTGTAKYDDKTIANYDGKARGPGTTMQTILSQSLNVGAAYVAVDKLGPDKFREYFNKYGLNAPTGIDLPNEAEPLVKNVETSPRKIEYATASFGQGFAVTPIAMARALATLANHGTVPSPHVGLALDYPGELPSKVTVLPTTQAISPEAAETVTRMLVSVVDKSLRNGSAKIPELSVAAKTGTAQMANPAGGGYYKDRYLHSFFGYFPAYDAKFLIFFYAVAPQGAKYASETWTATFLDSVQFLRTYYNVPPDRATAE